MQAGTVCCVPTNLLGARECRAPANVGARHAVPLVPARPPGFQIQVTELIKRSTYVLNGSLLVREDSDSGAPAFTKCVAPLMATARRARDLKSQRVEMTRADSPGREP